VFAGRQPADRRTGRRRSVVHGALKACRPRKVGHPTPPPTPHTRVVQGFFVTPRLHRQVAPRAGPPRAPTVDRVSLADTLNRLEHRWTREERHDPPWRRWAAYDPALDIAPAELRPRLGSRDRASSGPILAALVELASRHGDHQAAELVTLALLPRMVDAERRGTHDTYDQLAGLLWEAVVTAPSPRITCLRESIERNVWRRKRILDRPLVALSFDTMREDRSGLRARRSDDPTAADAQSGHLLATLSDLEQRGDITAAAHRILVALAHGSDAASAGQSTAAARKQRQRTLSAVRQSPAVLAALTA